MEAGIFWQAKLWREGATLTTRTALPTTSAVLRKDDCCKQPTSRWTALLCEGFSMPVVKVFQCLSSVADRSRGTTHPSWDLWEGIERGTRRGSFRNVGLARFSQLCDSWSPNSACADYQVQGHSKRPNLVLNWATLGMLMHSQASRVVHVAISSKQSLLRATAMLPWCREGRKAGNTGTKILVQSVRRRCQKRQD